MQSANAINYSRQFQYYLNIPAKMVGKFIHIADEIRTDMESLQQFGFTCYSLFRIYYFRTPEGCLPPVLGSLNRVQEIDFFNILKFPQYIKHRYTAESVDPLVFLDNICNENHLSKRDDVQGAIETFLECIDEKDLGYFTQTQFKNAFQMSCQPLSLKLASVEVRLKSSPLLLLSDLFAIMADILCVPVFLQEWSILDLSKIAHACGKFRFLKWLPNQCADNWVKRFLCIGFAFRFLQACCDIRDERTTSAEKRANQVCAIASLGECILNISLLRSVNERYISLILLLPKPTGLLYKFMKPSPTYFHKNDNN